MLWTALFACDDDPASGQGFGRDPVPADACVGQFQLDVGDDGLVDARGEHVITSEWDEVSTWWLGSRAGEGEIWFRQFDEDGLLVLERNQGFRGDELLGEATWTWTRDEDGRVLVETLSSAQLEYRADHAWSGDLLDHVEYHYDNDGLPDQIVTWIYDPDGRPIEELESRTPGEWDSLAYTYFEPAPSLDRHEAWDGGDDGTVDGESDAWFDEAGRPIESTGVNGLGTFAETWAYDGLGNLVHHTYSTTWDSGYTEQEESTTTRDADGRPLESVSWQSQNGVESASRQLWAWDCP